MSLPKLVLLTAAALFLAGCTPSLYPLFTEKDLIFASELAGYWTEEDGDAFLCRPSAGKSYEVVYTNKEGTTARFQVHLVQIGKYRFIDVFPDESALGNSLYRVHLVRCHTFGRIWTMGGTLRIAMQDPGWLKQMLRSRNLPISHHLLGTDLVLAASTSQLQALVVTYAEDPLAFPDPGNFKKQK